jgi:hypothetical protein
MGDFERSFQIRRRYWLLLIVLVTVVFAVFLSREIVIFWLNLSEFGGLFIKPIYFGLLGGLVLATLALFRVDFKNRRSITWWFTRLVIRFVRSGGVMENVSPAWFDFDSFRLSPLKFLMWQVTKVLIGMVFLTNVMFGMAVDAVILGWESGLEALPSIFSLPFITPPLDISYAETHVFPLIPSLTLLVTPVFSALWIRLVLLVAATKIVSIVMPFVSAYIWSSETPSLSMFTSTMQALAAVFLSWFMFSMFFTSFIDYNTRYPILGLFAATFVLFISALLDKRRAREAGLAGVHPGFQRRHVYLRLGPLVMIALIVGSVMLLNNSIADVRKLEMLGPYNAQLISVNRYFAELDKIQEAPYEFGLTSIPPDQIDSYVAEQEEFLEKVRLWDHSGSFDKLRPEIGLIPYIDFTEVDILRFNETLYWSASMDLVLPATVRPDDRWYAIHFVYTHVPSGFLMLDAHTGRIVDAAKFFPQRRIYYGERGLFQETWVAYPIGRTVSDEVGGYLYDGRGGIGISPPMSWLFEPNFLLSYPTTAMHVLRYRDVHERMELLFPYFIYEFWEGPVDMWPVTDGENTFWAMPLVVFLDAKNVPWSGGQPLARLVGYALIDVYHGDIQLIITGDDYFSQLFKRVYSEHVSTEVPDWLKPQLRYPEELFEWRIAMYNYFHVTDTANYIAAKEFFKVPGGVDTYYIIAHPPRFDEVEFIGLLSLELRGALGENLAGYMIVRNDYPHTGEMIFSKVPMEAEAKLLGPTAIDEALERNPDFAQLRTLLRDPRVGNHIFYRIGDYDMFFIPVYTAPGGGVVTQIGTIATVGADFTGEYYVGLGSTIEESFRAFLAEIAGVEVLPPTPEFTEEERIAKLVDIFEEAGLIVLNATSINPDVSFLKGSVEYVSEEDWINVQPLLNSFLEHCDEYNVSRVFMWTGDGKVNFGIMVRVEEVLELHYITFDLTL